MAADKGGIDEFYRSRMDQLKKPMQIVEEPMTVEYGKNFRIVLKCTEPFMPGVHVSCKLKETSFKIDGPKEVSGVNGVYTFEGLVIHKGRADDNPQLLSGLDGPRFELVANRKLFSAITACLVVVDADSDAHSSP